MRRVYLDNNATTEVHPAVLESMIPIYGELYGNPSSIHGIGREASSKMEEARETVAGLINCDPDEIYFTSGGTEADNLALIGTAMTNSDRGRHVITSSIEHHAVLESCHFLEKKGFEVTYLPVDGRGFVDPDDLRKAIRKDTILVSIMHVNNEIGTIQDIPKLSSVAMQAGVYFHTDAVQSIGKLPVNVAEMGVDMLSMSAHKINGPKGIGFLYVKQGTRIEPILHGGSHERHMRAGTENVAGIVGLAKALEISCGIMDSELERYEKFSDRMWEYLRGNVPDIALNGPEDRGRLKNTLNISFKGIESEAMLLRLDAVGIAVASGSACSSGSAEPSHVMKAIGADPLVFRSSVRISFGKFTTEEDVEYALEQIPPIVERLRKMSPVAGRN
jgi:cysteine desulfurase